MKKDREKRTVETVDYPAGGRYLLTVAFDGSNYCGWQVQPNGITVQEVMQKTMSRIFDMPIRLLGSSRTDAGVHAAGFPASFLYPVRPSISADKLKRALNRLLPKDIRIVSIEEKDVLFHPRFDAFGKAYTYVINLGDETPFTNRFSFHPRYPFDLEKLRAAIPGLLGTHDYSAFVAQRKEIDDDAVRTIYRIDSDVFDRYCCLTFVGDGFLYKMVRNLAGTLIAAGTNRIQPEEAKILLENRDRTRAPDTAPACGLFLVKVFYEEEAMHDFKLPKPPFTF